MTEDPLPSWADGAARSAILDFVARVGDESGPDYVTPSARVAVFDNDGTLWCEKPAYAQAMFLLVRLREQAAADPDLAAQSVVKALLGGDVHAAVSYGVDALSSVLLDTHAGFTAEEFETLAKQWLEQAEHERFGVRFAALTYVPMLELIDTLRAHGFRVFVVTGGGVEFVRAVSEEAYGVTPDDVIGSAVQLSFERRGDRVVLVRQAALLGSPNEGAPKALNIQAHIGQRPIFAAGNSSGDTEMLEYAHSGDLPSLCIVVDHDDEQREYAYAGTSLTNPGAEPIADTAARRGWTLVSMRDAWRRIFLHDGSR